MLISTTASLGILCTGSAGILIIHGHILKCRQHTFSGKLVWDMSGCRSRNACIVNLALQLCPLTDFHGKAPGKQPTACLFDLGLGSQVRSEYDWLIISVITVHVLLSPSLPMEAVLSLKKHKQPFIN